MPIHYVCALLFETPMQCSLNTAVIYTQYEKTSNDAHHCAMHANLITHVAAFKA